MAKTHTLTLHPKQTRDILVMKMINLPEDSSVEVIVNSDEALPRQPDTPLPRSKESSLLKLKLVIIKEHLGFYGFDDFDDIENTTPEDAELFSKPAKIVKVGHPKKVFSRGKQPKISEIFKTLP